MTTQDPLLSMFREAATLYQRGRPAEAKVICLSVLREQPEHLMALHLLSNIEGQSGHHNAAERTIRKAIRVAPREALLQMTLGQILRAKGDLRGALGAFEAAAGLAPKKAECHYYAGLMCKKLGDYEQAIRHLQRAVGLQPNMAMAFNELGVIQQTLHRSKAAQQSFQSAIHAEPEFAPAHNNLGVVFLHDGRLRQAVQCFENALRYRTDYPAALYNLARAQHGMGDIAAARATSERHVTVLPDAIDGRILYGNILQASGELDVAEAQFRKVLREAPNNAAALAALAECLEWRGDYQQACEVLAPAMRAGSADPHVIVAQARLDRRMGQFEEGRGRLETLLRSDPGRQLPADVRRQIHFVLGDVCDAEQDYPAAFENFLAANRLKSAEFDPGACEHWTTQMIATLDSATLRRLPRARQDLDDAVFIVGMPRSGTSLVEQILATNSAVHAIGETGRIAMLARRVGSGLEKPVRYPLSLRLATARELTALANDYRSDASPAPAGASRIVEKMPLNFQHLGMIELLFPRAQIVHCVRHPADVALSCFFQDFIDPALSFSFDLEHIGAFFAQYQRLMSHWREVCSLPVHEIEYESLVRRPEETARSLFRFIDLKWDESALRFFESDRLVNTASHAQVRQPVYAHSMNRHRNYTDYLDDFWRGASGKPS